MSKLIWSLTISAFLVGCSQSNVYPKVITESPNKQDKQSLYGEKKPKEDIIQDEIDDLFANNRAKCSTSNKAVTNFNNKIEIWDVCHLNDGGLILTIESYKDGVYYQEIYFEANGNLIFANEIKNYTPMNHYAQIPLYINYYIKDNKVSTRFSGLGKMQNFEWDPNEIFDMYDKRLEELVNIEDIEPSPYN